MITKKDITTAAPSAQSAVAELRTQAIGLQRYIERQLKTVVQSAPGTANVTLTVTGFRGVKNPRTCEPLVRCKIALVGASDRVKALPVKRPTKLVVYPGGPLNFRFTVVAGDKSGNIYYPIGIAFCLKNSKTSTPNALHVRQTFASGAVHIYGTSMFFTDDYNYSSRGDIYNYYVIIQNANDGQVGVIDPTIVHYPPMPPGLSS
jgi:hypothetical protein